MSHRLLERFIETWSVTHRMLVKDGMALYQHTARCPSAIQWFLDENPEYWPFIPIKDGHDSEQESIGQVKDVIR